MQALRSAAACAALAAGMGAADAQTIGAAVAPARTDDAFRYRATALGEAPRGVRDRDHDLAIALQRRTTRMGATPSWSARGETGTLSYDVRARSRVTAMRVEDRFAIADGLTAGIGWRGYKVSNRNANATMAGADRLAAHDWFLPQASLAYRAGADLTLSLGYRETLRAFEGAGSVGAMGLTRAGFDTLRATLRPERSHQVRLDGQWAVHDVNLSLGGFHVDARDALGFAGRSYMPVNSGAVALSGMSGAIEHQLTPRLAWSARYRRARGHSLAAGAMREDELVIGGAWRDGAWRATVAARRAVALSSGAWASAAAARIEAGVEYDMAPVAGRPLRLSARLTDPSRLASVRLMEDTGAVRAADRARAVMVGAKMPW